MIYSYFFLKTDDSIRFLAQDTDYPGRDGGGRLGSGGFFEDVDDDRTDFSSNEYLEITMKIQFFQFHTKSILQQEIKDFQ